MFYGCKFRTVGVCTVAILCRRGSTDSEQLRSPLYALDEPSLAGLNVGPSWEQSQSRPSSTNN